jgi:nicotinamide-nucleotide amidase
MLGERITTIPGSSRYYLGGVVAYDNRVKIDQLGVTKTTIEKFGAVSSETARAMARGIRDRFKADIGVSVTGIAGPDGGTEEKPVGTVFIGLAIDKFETARKFNLGTDREMIRERTVSAALDLVRRSLLDKL